MEYSDDSAPVEPGTDLTLDGSDIGRASYDADSDGVADSVVIGDGQYTVVATDSDGDGDIDDVTGYDADGNELDAGSLGMPGSGSGPAGSDSTPPDGTDPSDGTDTSASTASAEGGDGTDATGLDTAAAGSPTPGSGTDTDTGTAGAVGISTSSGADGSGTDVTGADAGTAEPGDTPSLSVIDDQGRSVDLGPAEVDMNGDGTPDTSVVRGDDGSTVGYTDRNGDGEVDQITRVEADNSVIITVSDGNGDWSVVATGQLDDDGNFVPSESDSAGTGTGAAGTDASGYRQEIPTDSGSDSATDSATRAAADSAAAAPVPASDPATDADSAAAADTGTDSTTASAGDDGDSSADADLVYTDQSGQAYQLGSPTADFDGDGVNDTVVTTLANGTVVGYSDIDGDGHIDQVTQIDPDGSVTVGVPDGSGGWEQAATGTIGPEGQFVAAGGPTSTGGTADGES
ncbi:DUF6802 family protein [Nakamurella aerolata]|uniref:DUF6802 domain-containing protein n=1 Tax=Nakamurella aerolata TaxID=1656892 RepID=A0A849A848_9ACTN|nr:DUF6802 family protein [Nakamurella aerolata]NNG36729.1 hypothetical protein [Nakamurella aerolata]